MRSGMPGRLKRLESSAGVGAYDRTPRQVFLVTTDEDEALARRQIEAGLPHREADPMVPRIIRLIPLEPNKTYLRLVEELKM